MPYADQTQSGVYPEPAPLSWFTRSTGKFAPLIAELITISVVLRLIGLVEPFIFQTLIDRVLPFQRVASLNLILVILVATTLFSAVLGVLSTLLATQMANRLTSELGRRVYEHVLSLPARLLEKFEVGAILARLREIDTIRAFLTGTAVGLALDLAFAIVYLAALLALSPQLTMIVLIMLPAQLAAFAIVGPFLRARLQESFNAGAVHQARLVEAFGNLMTVKALVSENSHCRRISATLDESLRQGWRVTKLAVINDFLGMAMRGGTVVLIIYFGTGLVFANEMTLGQLIAFHLLAQNVSEPIMSLSTIWEKWQGLRISRLRLGDFLNVASERAANLPVLPMGAGRLQTRMLAFGYDRGNLVFEHLDLAFEPRTISVIVGDSGCGKSTLAKLLAGLYAPSSGEVEYDGKDIANHDPGSVRRRIGYVPQEPILFSGTISENLEMAAPANEAGRIAEALDQAAASEFIQGFPNGLETQVGERGSFLSGGQRQRIALARALLTGPDVLVLDEPTSSLDEATARIVMENLARLSTEKTIIIITHRPDLIDVEKNVVDLNKLVDKTGTGRMHDFRD